MIRREWHIYCSNNFHMRNSGKRTAKAGAGRLAGLAMAVCGSLVASCASTGSLDYRPSTVGFVGHPVSEGGPLEVTVECDRTESVLGEPLPIVARIRNAGLDAVWVPREPVVVFTWMYPSGQRDNNAFRMPEDKDFTEVDARKLRPGDEMTVQVEITTQYIPTTGITEFGAVLILPRNTNSSLGPFAEGTYRSNRFGVNLIRR